MPVLCVLCLYDLNQNKVATVLLIALQMLISLRMLRLLVVPCVWYGFISYHFEILLFFMGVGGGQWPSG